MEWPPNLHFYLFGCLLSPHCLTRIILPIGILADITKFLPFPSFFFSTTYIHWIISKTCRRKNILVIREYTSDLLANLSWFQEMRSGQRDRKFNGWTAGIRMHVHSWLRCTPRESDGREVWYTVRGTGKGTKGERKVRGNVKSGISRRLELYIYILYPMCTLRFAYDIRYVIRYFGECLSILGIASVYTSLSLFLSFNTH